MKQKKENESDDEKEKEGGVKSNRDIAGVIGESRGSGSGRPAKAANCPAGLF